MMQQVVRKLSFARSFLEQGDIGEIRAILRTKMWSTEQALGLGRDLTVSEPGISTGERRDRTSRLHLLDAGFSSCFVATTADDQACYIQWLISPRENDRLRSAFDGLFPWLEDNEMLLEGAYTPVAFRGQRIMPAAMALIAERAAGLGAERALTFVGEDNVPSLKGCKRAGFSPVMRRQGIHRLGYRRMVFTPLPAGTPYAFDAQAAPVSG